MCLLFDSKVNKLYFRLRAQDYEECKKNDANLASIWLTVVASFYIILQKSVEMKHPAYDIAARIDPYFVNFIYYIILHHTLMKQ